MKKMENELTIKLNLILRKYEKIGQTNSNIYKELKRKVASKQWIAETAQILNKVQNSERIFNISKEINESKSDQRVLEMFAEFDIAQRLVNTKFFGNFDSVEYLPKHKTERRPDFLPKSGKSISPVEVKLLSPQGLDEKQFFQKFIDKVNDQAIKQLQGYYKTQSFKLGIIFVWSHRPINLHKIKYHDLKKYLEEKIAKQNFDVTIVCILSKQGLWDFNL